MIEKMIGKRPNIFFLICWKYISPIATLVQFLYFTHILLAHIIKLKMKLIKLVCSIKRLDVSLLFLDGALVNSMFPPPPPTPSISSSFWFERDNVRVKCFAQQHNTVTLAMNLSETGSSQPRLIHKIKNIDVDVSFDRQSYWRAWLSGPAYPIITSRTLQRPSSLDGCLLLLL